MVTDIDDFEDGERGFLNAVENAEGANRRPITPRVLESLPVPQAEAPAAPVSVNRPAGKQSESGSAPGRADARAPTPVVRDASSVVPPIELLDVRGRRAIPKSTKPACSRMADRLAIVLKISREGPRH